MSRSTPSPRAALKRVAKSNLALSCVAYIAHDWIFGRRLAAGRIETDSGRRHSTLDLDASLGYVEKVYSDYCSYAGVGGFSGTVGELGPGDSFGVALLLLHGGAREVHAIARYYSRRDPEQQQAIYRALATRHQLGDRFRDGHDEDSIRGLSYHAGEPAEAFFRQSGIRFDAILWTIYIVEWSCPLQTPKALHGETLHDVTLH